MYAGICAFAAYAAIDDPALPAVMHAIALAPNSDALLTETVDLRSLKDSVGLRLSFFTNTLVILSMKLTGAGGFTLMSLRLHLNSRLVNEMARNLARGLDFKQGWVFH